MSLFDERIDYPVGGLPPILSGWELQYVVPSEADYVECPDLCTEQMKVQSIDEILTVQSSVAAPRFYLTMISSPRVKVSYCDAYATRREAITETMRSLFLSKYKARACLLSNPAYGNLKGYGCKSRIDDTAEVMLLVDDLPVEFKTNELTREKFGADIDAQDIWYIFTHAPASDVIWIDHPDAESPVIDLEAVAQREFERYQQDYME